MEKTIIVDNKCLHLILGKTQEEWSQAFGDDDLWDFPIEELLDGTIEINEGIWYFLINGRCYETDKPTI